MEDDILEKSFVVYLLTNKVTSKSYVGKTTQMLKLRLRNHKCNKKSLIGRAIHAHGWENFTVEILEECATEAELNEREIYWIKTLNTKHPNGYNLTDGGESGYKVSEKSRQLRSENSPCKRAIRCIDTDEIFPSITAAAKHFNISRATIGSVCRGEHIRVGGLKFEYVDTPLSEADKLREAQKPKGKAIRCIDTNEQFNTIAEAARYFHLDGGHISAVCCGHALSTGGLHFEFLDNELRKQAELNRPPSLKKPVRCIETSIEYESAAVASKETGANSCSIGLVCRGKLKTAGGYHWQFVTP